MVATENPLLEVKDLVVDFRTSSGLFSGSSRSVRAVDGVSLTVYRGETLGIVGESGCGKTTLGRAIVRLVKPTRGHIILNGTDLLALKGKELRLFRPRFQMIFQNPVSALDPRMRVFDLVAQPLRAHFTLNDDELTRRVEQALEDVGIYKDKWEAFPSALSGGQGQRVAIARALTLNPGILVLDEPTSALDVSVQAQVVNLLRRLQAEFGLTYIFISHDLTLVNHVSDRIVVMYLGQEVEIATRHSIFNDPKHPYTQALLSASPVPDPDRRRGRIVLSGTVPDPADPPSGCRFHTRCPFAEEICRTTEPRMVAISETQYAACHLVKT